PAMGFDGVGDERTARVLFQHVDRYGTRLGARRFDLLDRGLAFGHIAPGHDDRRAGLRHAQRHPQPDAAVAARDDGNATGKVEKLHATPPSRPVDGLYSECAEPETVGTVTAPASRTSSLRAGRADRRVANEGGGGRRAAAIFVVSRTEL